MIFNSGQTHFFRKDYFTVFNGITGQYPGNAQTKDFYNWLPEGTTIEVTDFYFSGVIGMKATKQSGIFSITDNPNNGTTSFLIKSMNRLNLRGSINTSSQDYVARYKMTIPNIAGSDGNTNYDVGSFTIQTSPPVIEGAPSIPPIDFGNFNIDFGGSGMDFGFGAEITPPPPPATNTTPPPPPVGGYTSTGRDIVSGNNTFVWNGNDGLQINPTNIPNAITSIIASGVVATRLPSGVWVGSLTSLTNGQAYTFVSTATFPWPYEVFVTPPPPAPPVFVYDENFHPLDFNKDGNVDVMDVQVGIQLFGQSSAMMVTKFIQDENPFDYNGDGIVDISDIVQASSQGVAPHILQYMSNLATAPPYDPTPPVQMNGSAYHPLDINQDGIVNVMDIASLGSQNLSQEAREIIGGMIVRYSLDQNPYDINQDGNVNVLDIMSAVNAGVPQIILQDMQNNLHTQAPPPPEPIPELPGCYEHLYSNGEYADMTKLLRFKGPIHKEIAKNGAELYYTGATKQPTRRMLVLISSLDNPNVVKDQEGFTPRPFLGNGGGQY